MSHSYPLDQIIREVPASERVPTGVRRLFAHVTETAVEVKMTKPLLTLRGTLKTYFVKEVDEPLLKCDGGSFMIYGPAEKKPLKVNITYDVLGIVPDTAGQPVVANLVRAAARATHAGEAVVAAIRSTLKRRVDTLRAGGSDPVEDFVFSREEWESSAGVELRDQMFLDARVRLSPDGISEDEEVEPRRMPPMEISIRVPDCSAALTLKIGELTLVPHGTLLILSAQSATDLKALEKLITRAIERHFLERKVTLHAFCLSPEAVNEQLKSVINESLRTKGWEIGHWSVEHLHQVSVVPMTETIAHTVESQIHNWPKPVVMSHLCQLELESLDAYHRAGSPALEKWIRSALDRITRQVMIEQDIGSLAREFALERDAVGLEATIRNSMAPLAEKIGYKIKVYTSKPQLQVEPLIHGFPVSIEGDFFALDSMETTFPVEVACGVRIPNPTTVEQYFDPDRPIAEVVKLRSEAEIRRATTELFKTVSMRRLCLELGGGQTAEGGNLAEELRVLATTRLSDLFGAMVDSFSVRPSKQNKVLDIYQRVTRASRTLKPIILRPSDSDVKVPYCVSFQILGVAGESDDAFRHFFSTCCSGEFKDAEAVVNQIEGLLQMAMNEKLPTLPEDFVVYDTDDARRMLVEFVFKTKLDFISSHFGLKIDIVGFYREASTDQETSALIHTSKTTRDLARLEDLHRERDELIDQGMLPDYPRLVAIDKAIEEIEGRYQRVERKHRPLRNTAAEALYGQLAAPEVPHMLKAGESADQSNRLPDKT